MNLALFDFDGTITTEDTFTPFLRFAVPAIRQVVGGFVVSPVFAAHRLGLISSPTVRPFVSRIAFQGVRATAIQALGKRYASDVIPTVIRRRAMECMELHREQGDTIVVVSAGLDVYLRPWCDSQGVALICTELEERGGQMTGRYVRGDCSGRKKVELIRSAFSLRQFDAIYAYGDTPEDRAMLALANRRFYRWRELRDGEQAG